MAEGAPITRMMAHYVTKAFDLVADAEANAILASSGDANAASAIEARLNEMEELLDELDAEFPS
jgi:hypothetical protein